MRKYLTEKTIEEMVLLAQNGDKDTQDYLIRNYQPFIAKTISEVCKRYIDQTRDEEFSIGLTAFNEAIFSFNSEKGSSFLSFAKLVIKRKIIDYIRANKKIPQVVSLDENYDNEQMENPAEITVSKEKYMEKRHRMELREEILAYKEKLKEYKLSLDELTVISPKHRDARDSAVKAARILYMDTEMRNSVVRKKKLPIKELLKKVEVSKKTLERNRKYILAIFIVLNENYMYLKEYLKGVGQ
ncbi:RNA polymerase sigma-I factor [Oceanobacillus piezotolerans]